MSNGILLPENLRDLPQTNEFPKEKHQWNTNEEIASILISFDNHCSWQHTDVYIRPPSGSMLLYSRKRVRYRKDGYCWKKRKDGKTTREDHMKLKVRGIECIYGCYVHSAILPTFHRRCYWLLQNPDVVLVHYLNVPTLDDSKLSMPSLSACVEKKEWSKGELMDQLRPMFAVSKEIDPSQSESLSEETLESITQQLLNQQTRKIQQSTGKTHECMCEHGTSSMADCRHTKCRIISPKMGTTLSSRTKAGQTLLVQNHQQSKMASAAAQGGPVVNGCERNGGSNTPLILNLSQLQGSNRVIILSGNNTTPISVINNDSTNSVASHHINNHGYLKSDHNNSVYLEVPSDNVTQQSEKTQSTQNIHHSMNESSIDTNVKQERQMYNQNLQLSPDELQKMLNANLPITISPTTVGVTTEAMDTGRILTSPETPDLNFDAFDMLDLSDFDNLGQEPQHQDQNTGVVSSGDRKSATPAITCASCLDTQKSSPVKTETREGIANITDFAPDWAYPEGNIKILVTGPWYSTTSPYSVVFDGVQVPAALVQSGVLRCFCPAHAPGLVTLQVACEGFVISNSVVFEYKAKRAMSLPEPQPSVTENQLRVALVQRLEAIEKRLGQSDTGSIQQASHAAPFEDRVCSYCEQLARRSWIKSGHLSMDGSYSGMTLLHLAASLGYAKLITTLIRWRTEKPDLLLEYEVDSLSLDDQSFTPMLWACTLGHLEAALVLYHWNRASLDVCNRDGLRPLAAAKKNGHNVLAQKIEQLEQAAANQSLPSSPMPENQQIFLSPGSGTASLSSSPGNSGIPNFGSQMHSDATPNNVALRVDIPHTTSHTLSPNSLTPNSLTPKSHTAEKASRSRKRAQLRKRFSVDSSQYFSQQYTQPPEPNEFRVIRTANSDPHLNSDLNTLGDLMTLEMHPVLSLSDRELNSPTSFMAEAQNMGKAEFQIGGFQSNPSSLGGEVVTMEAEDSSNRSDSPIIDVETISDDDVMDRTEQESKHQMVMLANQIIAAMPERIKMSPSRADDSNFVIPRERSSSYSSFSSHCSTNAAFTEDSGMATITTVADPFSVEECRFQDTPPTSSVASPESSCLPSPYSFSLDSPPPTTEDFTEYFNAPTVYMERDFSQLTLSDSEQRNLYEAAWVIQNAYKRYKDKKRQQTQRQREIEAACLIQSYYRRYKQYAYSRRMSEAAVLIQSQFRSYTAQKQFKKSRDAAVVIQNQYRTYKEHERFKKSRNAAVIIQQRFRSHYQRKRKANELAGKGSQKDHDNACQDEALQDSIDNDYPGDQ